MNNLPERQEPGNSTFSHRTKNERYRITDVALSNNETCPTFMVANINPRFDINYNLSKIEEIVQTAHAKNVDVLILPELSVSGYVWEESNYANVLAHLKASDNRQPVVQKTLQKIKAGLVNQGSGLKLVFFSNVRNDGQNGKLYDTTFVLAPGIDYNEAYYDKFFLTPLEKRYFNRGSDRRLVIETQWGRMGVLICYEACFVDMAKKYAFGDDVDILITIAAWRKGPVRAYPALGIELNNYYQYLWNLKHAAMASHNQVWSIGANCVGVFEKTGGHFCGQSGLWSPSGIPLIHASEKEEELLIIRNVEIRGHLRHRAKDDFDYRLDYDEVARDMKEMEPKRVFLDGRHKQNATGVTTA